MACSVGLTICRKILEEMLIDEAYEMAVVQFVKAPASANVRERHREVIWVKSG